MILCLNGRVATAKLGMTFEGDLHKAEHVSRMLKQKDELIKALDKQLMERDYPLVSLQGISPSLDEKFKSIKPQDQFRLMRFVPKVIGVSSKMNES